MLFLQFWIAVPWDRRPFLPKLIGICCNCLENTLRHIYVEPLLNILIITYPDEANYQRDHRYEKLLEQWRKGLGFQNLPKSEFSKVFQNLNSPKSSKIRILQNWNCLFSSNQLGKRFLKPPFGGRCGDHCGARWSWIRNCSTWPGSTSPHQPHQVQPHQQRSTLRFRAAPTSLASSQPLWEVWPLTNLNTVIFHNYQDCKIKCTVSQEWSQPMITPIRDFFAWIFLSHPYMHGNDSASIICLGFSGFLTTDLGSKLPNHNIVY